jgi:hypothetical protein
MPICRQLDMMVGDGVILQADLNQTWAVNCFRFLRYCAAQGLCTIIASNYGASATGEDYHDGSNPLGENAFIVAAWNAGTGQDFYVLFQWANTDSFGAAPGAPGLIDAGTGDGVGFQMAVRDDGGNPWAGTQNDDGADTKGATPGVGPVWAGGPSTVRVFPRSNATGGAHVGGAQNCVRLINHGSARTRGHFVANENTILMIHDATNAGAGNDSIYSYHIAMGRYTPVSHLTSLLTTPYFMLQTEGTDNGFWSLGSSTLYGDAAGTLSRQGGVVALPVNDTMACTLSTPSAGQTSTFYQPNNLISPNTFEPTPISIFAHESGKTAGPNGTGDFGLCGFPDIEIVSAIYNSDNHQTNATGDIAYIGDNIIATRKHAISWDAGAAPGTQTQREGRQSFTA